MAGGNLAMHVDEKKKFDKRTIERRIREGLISRKEYKEYLASLPDVSDKIDHGKDEATKQERRKKARDK